MDKHLISEGKFLRANMFDKDFQKKWLKCYEDIYGHRPLPLDIDLVAGGPPCQPFSLGGKHRAHRDNRDMFPVTVEVIRNLKPRVFIVENVKGLTRSSFHNYYQHILLQLEFPELVRKPDESWNEHSAQPGQSELRQVKE